MLLIRGGELVHAGGRIQHIVVIIVGFGIQGSLQAGKTGVCNGAGGQTLVEVGVVGMIQFGVDPFILTFLGIDDGGVDVQQGTVIAPMEQTVIDNTGNLGTFSRGMSPSKRCSKLSSILSRASLGVEFL